MAASGLCARTDVSVKLMTGVMALHLFPDGGRVAEVDFYERCERAGLKLTAGDLTAEHRTHLRDVLQDYKMFTKDRWDRFLLHYGPETGALDRLSLLMSCRFFHPLASEAFDGSYWEVVLKISRRGTFVIYPCASDPKVFRLHYHRKDDVITKIPFEISATDADGLCLRVLKASREEDVGRTFQTVAQLLEWKNLSEDRNRAELARPPGPKP